MNVLRSLLLASFLLLSACSYGATRSPAAVDVPSGEMPLSASSVPATFALPPAAGDRADAKPLTLFVSDGNDVTAIDALTGQHLSFVLSNLKAPQGLAVDAGGFLYVTEGVGNDILVFKPFSTVPTRMLSDPASPQAVAVGSDGTVFVGNTTGPVEVYAPGANAPTGSIDVAPLTSARSLALDGHANLYAVGDRFGGIFYNDRVVRCAPEKTACTEIQLHNGGNRDQVIWDVTIDTTGNFVESFRRASHHYVKIYRPTPGVYVRIGQFGTNFPNGPFALAMAPHGDAIFVQGPDAINEYYYPSGHPKRAFPIHPKGTGPYLTGIAVSPAASPGFIPL